MLKDHLKQEPSKSEMAKKVAAWETLNKILVKTNAEFANSLQARLTEKEKEHEALKEILDKGDGTEEQNATYIFLGGYIQCLKDILHAKKA